MAEQKPQEPTPKEQTNDSREQRMMWIFSGSIVLLILGAMGANMLFHKEKPAGAENTDISAQSRPAPER